MLRELVGIHKRLEKWKFPRGKIKIRGRGVCRRGSLQGQKGWQSGDQEWACPRFTCGISPASGALEGSLLWGTSEEREHAGHC